MEYRPNPVDLTKVELSQKLQEDIEKIARNIHETWGMERQKQGWSYGEIHDAEQKKHPCMIPYEDLPESEKDIDRATVEQTIKMLLFMGYTIEK